MKMNKKTYAEIMEDNISFINRYAPNCMTTSHIEDILRKSIEFEYPSDTGAKWMQEQDKWISVEDRLPEERNDILIVTKLPNGKSVIAFDYLVDGYFYRHIGVTHWQPLPSPPKTKQNENSIILLLINK